MSNIFIHAIKNKILILYLKNQQFDSEFKDKNSVFVKKKKKKTGKDKLLLFGGKS